MRRNPICSSAPAANSASRNFLLLWQLAYTELYFTDTFWPDFGRAELMAAILSYQKRERRFGRTSEQLLEQKEGFLMLGTRVITAVILLAVLLPVLFIGSIHSSSLLLCGGVLRSRQPGKVCV